MTAARKACILRVMTGDPDDEILIEMARIGAAMEVRAVSGIDGLEVSFTAPANAAHADIQRVARQKLAYVRRKLQGEEQPETRRKDGKGGVVA